MLVFLCFYTPDHPVGTGVRVSPSLFVLLPCLLGRPLFARKILMLNDMQHVALGVSPTTSASHSPRVTRALPHWPVYKVPSSNGATVQIAMQPGYCNPGAACGLFFNNQACSLPCRFLLDPLASWVASESQYGCLRCYQAGKWIVTLHAVLCLPTCRLFTALCCWSRVTTARHPACCRCSGTLV